MIISLDKENMFDKLPTPFLIKTTTKNRRKLSQPDKGHLRKSHN